MKRYYLAIVVAAAVATMPLSAGAMAPHRHAAGAHLYHVSIGLPMPYSVLRVNKFFPDRLTVHAGDSVQWTNANPYYPQTVTFGPLEASPSLVITTSGTMEINPRIVKAQGGHVVGDVSLNVYSSGALMNSVRGFPVSYTFTFRKPGVYLYRSLFHLGTSGEIDVVAGNKSASPTTGNDNASLIRALRSSDEALFSTQSWSTRSANGPSDVQVAVGVGNENVSINSFIPAGVTVKVGSSVVWTVPETSGDLHEIVMGSLTSAERAEQVKLFTDRTPDGGLEINPAYAHSTALVSQNLTTDELTAWNNHIVSGLLYGSGVNSASNVASSYKLTFMAPGEYDYTDPFNYGMSGRVLVTP